jgi:hypothetical protein
MRLAIRRHQHVGVFRARVVVRDQAGKTLARSRAVFVRVDVVRSSGR